MASASLGGGHAQEAVAEGEAAAEASSSGFDEAAEARIGFRVVEASSSMDGYAAAALEKAHPHSAGWQSAHFADFPVTLVLQLERTADLRQLQILSHESKIASRVELFVAELPDGYQRLGFLSLDPNERSGYRARELKSVYIRARARYIKLVLHRNHANPVNLMSQVGLVALNVLGKRVSASGPSDLSVDMSLDPMTARSLRQLHAAKLRAVELEHYDEAKRLKHAIERLHKVGSDLARLEAQKRKAVQVEDYDTAKQIKHQMERLRLHAQGAVPTPSPAEESPEHDRDGAYYAGGGPSAAAAESLTLRMARQQSGPSPEPLGRADERPLPALVKHGDEPGDTNPFGHRTGSVAPRGNEADPDTAVDELLPPLPPLTDADRSKLHDLILVFGEETIRGLFSRKVWQHRSAAVEQVEAKVMRSLAGGPASVSLFVNGLAALRVALADPIAQVTIRAMSSLELLLHRVAPRLEAADIQASLEQTLPPLISRMNSRTRERARAALLAVMDTPEFGVQIVAKHLLKPLKSGSAPKPMQARAELLCEWVERASAEEIATISDSLVRVFLLPALRHRSDIVRAAGVQLAVAVHAKLGNSLLPLLEGVNPKLMSSLTKAFGATARKAAPTPLVGHAGPGHTNVLPPPAAADAAAAAAHPAAAPEAAANSPHSTGSGSSRRLDQYHTEDAGQNTGFDTGSRYAGVGDADEDHTHMSGYQDTGHGIDRRDLASDEEFYDESYDETVCRFCGMHDEAFVQEENLDLHYWRTCPMLVSCRLCEQVVEIPGLNQHLVTECEKSNQEVVLCKRCREPYSKAELPQHESASNCTLQKPLTEANRCPLCHCDIDPGEDGWRSHLLQPPGCEYNVRHV